MKINGVTACQYIWRCDTCGKGEKFMAVDDVAAMHTAKVNHHLEHSRRVTQCGRPDPKVSNLQIESGDYAIQTPALIILRNTPEDRRARYLAETAPVDRIASQFGNTVFPPRKWGVHALDSDACNRNQHNRASDALQGDSERKATRGTSGLIKIVHF